MWYRTGIWRVLAAAAVLGGLACLAVSPALAVVIAGDSSGNTSMSSPPADNSFPGTDPGWNNVGTIGNKTCVYLGNGWVLTAYHVVQPYLDQSLPVSATFGNTPYSVSSFHRLYLPEDPSQQSDLELLRLTTAPSLPSLPISSSTPATTSWVVGIGNGPLDRSPGIVYWNSGGTLYSGYTYDLNVQGLRWGEGQVGGALNGVVNAVSDGYGLTDAFYSTFANAQNSMQIEYGDSGGGVFSYNGTSWQLSGILLAHDNLSPVSGNVAVFGYTDTYMADLSQYQSQITQITPEPSSIALLLAGGAVFWTCRRFRARGRR